MMRWRSIEMRDCNHFDNLGRLSLGPGERPRFPGFTPSLHT